MVGWKEEVTWNGKYGLRVCDLLLDSYSSNFSVVKFKPVAQKQKMAIGTLALLWYFLMAAFM